MKKNLLISILLVVSLSLFTSCVSTISVQSWVPSQMDLTGYKTVGIKSTEANSSKLTDTGFQYLPVRVSTSETFTVPSEVFSVKPSVRNTALSTAAKTATTVLESSFNPEVYTVIGASKVDSIVSYATSNLLGKTVRQELLDNGIDLFVTSTIIDQNYEEFVLAEKIKYNNKDVIGYYICQRASLSLGYDLQNVSSAEIVGTGLCHGSYPTDVAGVFNSVPVYSKTLIGYSNKDGSGYTPLKYTLSLTADYMFSQIVESFKEEITLEVSPRLDNFYFAMLKDSSKSERMKAANDLVSAGNIKQAYEEYSSIYSESKLFEAGYNSTVLMFAMGDRSTALKMASDLWNSTYNKKAQTLYNRLKKMTDTQDRALSQITGEIKNSSEKELIGF